MHLMATLASNTACQEPARLNGIPLLLVCLCLCLCGCVAANLRPASHHPHHTTSTRTGPVHGP